MTDPTALARQVARKHARVTSLGECLCGATGIGFEVGYAEHIAADTEQTVRKQAAAQIEAEANRRDPDEEDWPSDPSQAITAAGLRIAARIVRGSKGG